MSDIQGVSINTTVQKPAKGKKAGTIIGAGAGLGVAAGIVNQEKALLKDTYTKAVQASTKANAPLRAKVILGAAIGIVGLAAAGAGALVGRLGGAIADKIAAKKAE